MLPVRSRTRCPGRTARRPAVGRPATSTLPSGSSVAGPSPASPCSRWRSRTRWPGRTARRPPARRTPAAGCRPPRAPCRRAAAWPWCPRAACPCPCGGLQPGGGSYSSARCVRGGSRRRPPRAPCHRAAAWPCGRRAASCMLPVAVQVPLPGSYSSAEASGVTLPESAAGHEHLAVGQQRGRVATRGV